MISATSAKHAIAVTEKPLSEAIGCYRQIELDKTICTFEDNGLPLEVAYQVARTTLLANLCKGTTKQIETTRINDQINKITNNLSALQGIKAKLTSIGKTSEAIATDLRTLEANIRESLSEMQKNLHARAELQ